MQKTLLLFLFVLNAVAGAGAVQLTEAGGWRETAYVQWLPVEGADAYHVYVSGEGMVNKRIDTQLIRSYGTYFRADVPGLAAGGYVLKVVPVTGGQEGEAASTQNITVAAHDRTGFAFADGRVPGAYKADGTPKPNAVVLYITENTKNTVSIEVTGANANPCVGIQTILDGFKKGRDNRPLIVRFVGRITDPAYLLNGDIVVENNNNAASYITLEGIGNDAVADGWGIRVKNASNVEVRNLGTMNCDSDEGDNISLQQSNEYIWVHHCDFFYGKPGGDADQAKGDGALDSKTSGFVTFAYNHFWDTGKSNLLGNGTEEPRYLSYHHNWYDHSDSRHPRVRSHHVHVFNNYYDGVAKYGVGSTNASSVFVEANYFRNCGYPMLISMQGSDVWSSSKNANDYTTMPTFSKENGGVIKSYNNYMTGQKRFVAWGNTAFPNSTVDFDAYVVNSAAETVPATVTAYKGGSSYSNFDTDPQLMYTYVADTPEAARDRVMQWAGRMQGGDFKWTFNNAVDDSSSDINPGLRDALASYRSQLVAVQGDGNAQGGGDDDEDDNGGGNDGPAVDLTHNFTTNGKESSFFTINGSLSDSKGTVQYGGLTLTICLKIESSTSIQFTTAKASVLTLVFNTGFTGKIKINGTDYPAVTGKVTLNLAAGTHTITKADVANLYLIGIAYETTRLNEPGIKELKMWLDVTTRQLIIGSTDEEIRSVALYSAAGNLVKAVSGAVSSFDVSELPRGVYIVKVVTKNGDYSQKLLK
ncbi:MAG: T9SS type A sorting domain-containing protein [Bacteroidales bacterium]|nr:T9SS type A sorting domain-containing protein [Bacteroidales bacterium]